MREQMEAADQRDAERRAYLAGAAPWCRTCKRDLDEAEMYVHVYGPTLYECEAFCDARCLSNFDGAPKE